MNATTPETGWTTAQTRQQFAAIAQLRWRITVNGFRRKGGAGEMVARILTWPILAGMSLGPTVAAGFGGYYFASNGQIEHISWLLWGTFALCQLLNINLGQPGTTFDPTQLIRFPMRAEIYVAIRLFFGLLTPANIIGTMMAFAIALGTIIAVPSLWLYALLTLGVFAAANVLFSRMVFAWVDRWLSTRRAREVFTGLIFAVSMGIQFLNFSFNPAYNHRHRHGVSQDRLSVALHMYHRLHPVLASLPPELTGSALGAAKLGEPLAFFGYTLACAAFAAAFLLTFALRMRTEFRGESFSDVANAVSRSTPAPARHAAPAGMAPITHVAPIAPVTRSGSSLFGLPSVVPAILAKEFLYVRRNSGIFYSLVAPMIMVFLFSAKFAARGTSAWIFPAALAYTLLGVSPLSYNSFGLEGTGAQFYFMAPLRLRDVFLAKNLINFLLALAEIAAVFLILSTVATMPSLLITSTAVLWAAATLLVNTTLGNRRSITAPKKIEMGRMGSKQASPLSSLIGMGILVISAGAGAAVWLLAYFVERPWILVPVMAVFAGAALYFYVGGLRSIDTFALAHRDELFEQLCKK